LEEFIRLNPEVLKTPFIPPKVFDPTRRREAGYRDDQHVTRKPTVKPASLPVNEDPMGNPDGGHGVMPRIDEGAFADLLMALRLASHMDPGVSNAAPGLDPLDEEQYPFFYGPA
jgi:hypothetical protein